MNLVLIHTLPLLKHLKMQLNLQERCIQELGKVIKNTELAGKIMLVLETTMETGPMAIKMVKEL